MSLINPAKKSIFRFYVKLSNIFERYVYSIRFKIIVLVILSILIPLSLFGAYMYSFIYHNVFEQHVNNELEQSVQQINDNLVAKFRIVDNAFNLILSNRIIRANLEEILNKEQTYYLQARTRLEIESQLKYSLLHDYAWNSGLLKSVFIFRDKTNYYYLLYNYLPNDNVLKDHLRFYESSEKLLRDKTIIKPSPCLDTIYFMKDVKTLITKKSIAKLVFGIDERILFDTYNNIINNKNHKAFIYDNEGTVFFHTDRNYIGGKIDSKFKKISNNSTEEFIEEDIVYVVHSEEISDMNMTSVVMVPKTEFTSDLYSIIPEYFYLILFAVIISTLISMYIVINITKPIKDLIVNIESCHNGNFEIKMPRYKYSELNEVSSNFNNMIDKIKYLFNEVYKKQILLKESELKALQAQINPHFIFNVLETISWEARMLNNETIYKMINSLGELLRARLTFTTREKIKIKEELEYVKFYLYLQKKRFGDKINIDISISNNSLLDYYIPKLSIQPIVENAFVHGLENKVGKGNLSISIKEDNVNIHIAVIDDGIGFDTNNIDINSENDIEIAEERKHIGLLNVNRRIKLIYGENYSLSLQSEINKGSKISILIPFDRGDI